MGIIIWLGMAIITAVIANKKDRNAVGWFFIGLLLGFIGLIIIAVLPNLKDSRINQEYANIENQRLKEQLNQERMKTEAFHNHARARLDSHDEHLGVDTRNIAQSLPPELPNQERLQIDAENKTWYYELEGEKMGPISEENLIKKINANEIDSNTLTWTEGMKDWKAIKDLDPFASGVNS